MNALVARSAELCGAPRLLQWAAIAAACFLASCASYRFLELPIREADLYPEGETRSGVSIAIDEMADPVRVRRYFAIDLLARGILPVQVIVSNHSEHRVAVAPSDVLLMSRRQVVDPVPVELVAQLLIQDRIFVSRDTQDKIRDFYADLAMRDWVVPPGLTYAGVLFFSVPQPRTLVERYYHALGPFALGSMRLFVAVTDLDQDERIRFGPFTLYR